MPPTPNFEHCVVHVVVDGAIASTVQVDAPVAAENDGSETDTVVAINTVLVPDYETKPRCTEHPAKPAAPPAANGGTWANDEVVWRLESRAIDTICTRDTFGPHSIFGELACRSSRGSGEASDHDSS